VAATDIALVSQVDQIGVEAIGSEGVAVTTNRLLQAMSLSVNPAYEIQVFGPAGQKADTLSIMNKEWATGDVAGAPTYDELVVPFSSIFGNGVTDVPPGGTASRRWSFAPRPVQKDVCRTFTHQKGSPGAQNATKSSGLIFSAFGFSLSKSGGTSLSGTVIAGRQSQDQWLDGGEVQRITITGAPTGGTFTLTLGANTTSAIAYNAAAGVVEAALNALASVVALGGVSCAGGPLPATAIDVAFPSATSDPAAMTATSSLTGGSTPAVTISVPAPYAAVTSFPLVPIAPGQVDVFMDDTYAALGTSQLLRDFVVEFSFGDRRNPIWPLNTALSSFDGTVEIKPNPTLSLKLGNDPKGRSLYTTIRTGGRKYVRVTATGPTIEAAISYKLTFDACVIVSDSPSSDDEDGLSTLTIPFRCVYDQTANLWMKAELINKTLTL